MARILIAGDAMVIESSRTLEEIKTLEKYRPKALALFDDDGEEVFRVGTTIGKGSISTYGASFCSASKNGEAKATITMEIPVDVADAEAYAEDTVGVAIINLNRVEAKLEEALASVRQEKTEIRNNITVL